MKILSKEKMKEAFEALDSLLEKPVELIMGGGGAMILAHQFPMATSDVDAVAKGLPLEKLEILIKTVARKLNLPGDWLNPYYSAFTHVLPADYGQRLIKVYDKINLTVYSLGAEDLLIMKLFAGRQKDIPHAMSLIKKIKDLSFVSNHIEQLKTKSLLGCDRALDFLDELMDEIE